MEIHQELRKAHSKEVTDRIVSYIGEDAERFSELMGLFEEEEYRIVQRAAWPLGKVAELHPHLLLPHYPLIIALLSNKNAHDAVKRNILRVLQFQMVPEHFQGAVLDTAFRILEDKKEPIAIRVFAMQVVYNLSKGHPELRRELRIIIEEALPYASAGFKSRAVKLLAKMEK